MAGFWSLKLDEHLRFMPLDPHFKQFGKCFTAFAALGCDIFCGFLSQILRTDIVMDVGNSINPAIDIGQVSYVFVPTLFGYDIRENF